MPESSEGHDNTRAAHVRHRCALGYSCEAMTLAPGTQHGRGVALRVRVYRPLAVMNATRACFKEPHQDATPTARGCHAAAVTPEAASVSQA